MKPQLFINDIALVNALGNDKQQIADNLFAGTQQGMVVDEHLLADGKVHVARVNAEMPDMSGYEQHYRTRNNQLALLALQQLETTLASLKERIPSSRIGIILGSSTSGIAEGEKGMSSLLEDQNWPEGFDYRMQEMSNLAEFVALASDISGLAFTISTACSSSAKSFITAQELIAAGVIDAAIVGGVDSLCGMTVNGFKSLESTSASICNPSSANRDGINIGEAAALAVLSKEPSNMMLLGWGESSDAHHMSAPHPEGEGAIMSMTLALETARLAPAQINYINLHGTATPKNDEMEAKAVHQVFGSETPVSSTKSLLGHTLGAAGATEVGICYLVIQHQRFAPHVWDEVKDPAMPNMNFINDAATVNGEISYCLTNSFAFGGNNVSLIIGSQTE